MKIDLITEDHLKKFKDEIIESFSALILSDKQQKRWLRGSEVREMLQISNSKLTDLRDSGLLTFSTYGNMYYYDIQSIYEQMDKSKVLCRHCA